MDTATRSEFGGDGSGRETLAAAVADGGLLAALVAFGASTHGTDPLAEPIATLEVVLPFLVGWYAVALLAGLYARDLPQTVQAAIRLPSVVWIAAVNVGLIVRASAFDGGTAHPFALVMTGLGLFVVVGWRVGYVVASGVRS